MICETGFLSGFYPNFSRFYSSRTVPIFPKPDTELADALRGLNEQARQAAVAFNGWEGFEDERVRTFLRGHPAVGSTPSVLPSHHHSIART